MSHAAVSHPEGLKSAFAAHLESVAARTAQALEDSGFAALLVHSGSLIEVFQDDRTYPFEANAPFKVWTPLDVADCFVWFEPGARPRLILNQPEDYWYKPAETPRDYWVDEFDLRTVPDRAAARKEVPASLARTAYVGDVFPELDTFAVGALNPPGLMRRLDYVRAAKTPYEIMCLAEANRLGAHGHQAAARAFAGGHSEFGIELAFLAACGLREQELPYNPIIALNANGAVLHYQLLEKTSPPERYSLLIDAGAEFAGYASDITRTHAAEDGEFRELIRAMDGMQRRLCGEVRAGVDWRDVHLRSHELVAQVLKEADLILCSPEEAVESRVTRVFLPHGIGHLLGLEVHDVGGFMASAASGEIDRPPGHPYLRLTRRLEEGFVVTMEPGLYFIDQLLEAARADERARLINWSRVADFSRYGGIRIEDNLAVTAAGCRNLTREAFGALGPRPKAAQSIAKLWPPIGT
ncbi:MAG TPA: Xaa-Pro dipeptidase [Steroidobacteraceae bacterium]|nr:Xaa-Pro dipeptidase [Steroidobacteraceae bacterium]